MKLIILVLINSLFLTSLYAPPMERGGVNCKKYIILCKNKNSKECIKHSTWALAFTSAIISKEFNIKKSKFNNELLSICMKKPDMFINAVAANIFLTKYTHINYVN